MRSGDVVLPLGTPVVVDRDRETQRTGTVAGHAVLFDGGPPHYVYLVDLGLVGGFHAAQGTFVRILVCDVGCVSVRGSDFNG